MSLPLGCQEEAAQALERLAEANRLGTDGEWGFHEWLRGRGSPEGHPTRLGARMAMYWGSKRCTGIRLRSGYREHIGSGDATWHCKASKEYEHRVSARVRQAFSKKKNVYLLPGGPTTWGERVARRSRSLSTSGICSASQIAKASCHTSHACRSRPTACRASPRSRSDSASPWGSLSSRKMARLSSWQAIASAYRPC